jgi:hypothetical protein
MKRICISGVLMGVAIALQCSALTVDITRVNGYYQYPGGEFNVTSVNPSDPQFLAILGHYSPSAIVSGGFETFCNSGNTGLQGNPQTATIIPNNVSLGGAWLYSQFALGILSGYDYNPSGAFGIFASRADAAYALQNAIWALNQTGANDLNTGAFGYSYFMGLAFGMFGNSETNAANGAYGVEELYLSVTSPNGGQIVAQPMLVLVPDGGSTVILLGMALAGIGYFSRRLVRT